MHNKKNILEKFKNEPILSFEPIKILEFDSNLGIFLVHCVVFLDTEQTHFLPFSKRYKQVKYLTSNILCFITDYYAIHAHV